MCDFKWTSLIVYGHSSGSMRLYGNAQMLTFSIYNVYHCHYPIWVASNLSFGHLCQKPAWTSHMHCCMYCTHQYTIQIGCYTHVNHDSSLCWRAKILLTIPIHEEHPRRMWMPFFLQVFGYKLKYTDKFKFLSEMLAITKDFRVHPEWDWMCEQNLEKFQSQVTDWQTASTLEPERAFGLSCQTLHGSTLCIHINGCGRHTTVRCCTIPENICFQHSRCRYRIPCSSWHGSQLVYVSISTPDLSWSRCTSSSRSRSLSGCNKNKREIFFRTCCISDIFQFWSCNW